MLEHLSIKNFALIERLEIQFDPGLNMLTGETGSGKSIILGALSLLLGERAESRVVQESSKKCVLEAVFSLASASFQSFFEENDLDFEAHTTLRREVLSSGKSRAFINDTPVTLKTLKELGLQLVDIHSQHQTLQINDAEYQLGVLDMYASSNEKLQSYKALFASYTAAKKALATEKALARESRNELDFIRFQVDELLAANLDEIDEAAIEEQYNMLTNAEEIAGKLTVALDLLSEGEIPVLQSLRQARECLRSVADYSKSYAELSERLNSTQIELDDIASEIDRLMAKVEPDPALLASVNEQRAAIFRLEQKHHVTGVAGLIVLRDALSEKLEHTSSADARIEALEAEYARLRESLFKKGKDLREKRSKSIASFSQTIVDQLKSLNMPHAAFEIMLTQRDEPQPDGLDQIEMRFSANAGRQPAPLRMVASGGELSRLMLAIKRMSAQSGSRTTIVFDEIDTGVSGEVANSMGKIMKDMADGLQVICITHLPQIAAKGSAHFKVFKTQDQQRTKTHIERLDEKARELEIAQMLSGAKTTEAALANARDLLYLN